MQLLIISGTIGKDAELRKTGNGDPVLSWSLAVDNGKDKSGNRRDSTWYDCALWGQRAEALERHITKGGKLTLQGRPSAREHNGKVYLGINVQDLTFMGGGQDRQSKPQYDQSPQGYGSAPAGGKGNDFDDEIPFMAEWR